MDAKMSDTLFILAGEASGDLHGAGLVQALLKERPDLKIVAVAGPRMRALPIETLLPMEKLQVMGFLDVLVALPRLIKQFFFLRNALLSLRPRALICIDYPGFNLRLAASLRKKGFAGALIHFICPTVWAWGKKRIPKMEKTLDLLLTLFPFEKKCFSAERLKVSYVGHPLAVSIPKPPSAERDNLLVLFPGSRKTEIERNFPLQLAAARRIAAVDPKARIAVSIAHTAYAETLRRLAQGVHLYPSGLKSCLDIEFFSCTENNLWMRRAKMAIATSGTVTLELALHETPTLVTFAIRPLDCFIAQKIFRIHLPHYCIVNIILSKTVFPEFFGPNLTRAALCAQSESLWNNSPLRSQMGQNCALLREALGQKESAREAALEILSTLTRPSVTMSRHARSI